jgi:hypothetical protein
LKVKETIKPDYYYYYYFFFFCKPSTIDNF